VVGAFDATATDIEAVRKMNEKNRAEHNDRGPNGFAIETRDALLRGIRVRPVGGVGHLELIVAVWAAREFASSPLG
jgi:hypothetical protein